MSDVQWLFVVLAALYGWECVGWLRRGGVVFSTWLGDKWSVQHPAALLGNPNGGFTFAPPVPPLGTVLSAYQMPFSLGPEGVLWYVAANVNPGWRPAQSGCFVSWAEVERLQLHGKKLCLHRQQVYLAPSHARAKYLLGALQQIAKRAAADRSRACEELRRAAFDVARIEALVQEWQLATRPVRLLVNTLFLLLFLVAPLLLMLVGLRLVWLPLVVASLGSTFLTATLFARRHRKFYPEAEEERFTQTLLIALAPATTLRALDYLARPLLENFHPLAVAKVLCAPDQFRILARRLLRDQRHPALPICPVTLAQAVSTEAYHRRAHCELVEIWLRECQIDPEELGAPPVAADHSCRAYCPRCEAQFTDAAALCSDCGGLALVPFAKAS